MPIYEFKCESCSHIDEHLMKISDPAPEKCTVCGGKVHKIMSMSSFSLKGTGWYATDYKNNAAASTPAVEGGETKPAEPAAEPAKTPDNTATKTEVVPSTPAKTTQTPVKTP